MKFGKKLLFLAFLGIIPAIQAMEITKPADSHTEQKAVTSLDLPDELLIQIFSHVKDPKTMGHLSKTSSRFYKLCKDKQLNEKCWLSYKKKYLEMLMIRWTACIKSLELLKKDEQKDLTIKNNNPKLLSHYFEIEEEQFSHKILLLFEHIKALEKAAVEKK